MPLHQLISSTAGRTGIFGSGGFGAPQRRVERLFDRFGRVFGSISRPERFVPRLDLADSATAVTVTVELPGLEEKDVRVTLSADRTITISGSKDDRRATDKADYRLLERAFGSFRRTIPLGFDAQPDAVEAVFANGVLTITVQKPAATKSTPTKIEISGD